MLDKLTAQLRVGDSAQAEIDGVVVDEDLAAVANVLAADEAVIFYSSAGGRYLAFMASRSGATAVSLDADREVVAGQVYALRDGLRLPFRVVGGKEVASGDPRDLPAFEVVSEQYYLLIDPAVRVLAETTIVGEGMPWLAGTRMPVAWTRQWGRGRVFYCALGHTVEILELAPVRTLLARAAEWARRRPGMPSRDHREIVTRPVDTPRSRSSP